jgi:hypothetical protein
VPNVQHLDVYAGENRTATLYARDSDIAVVSLSGKTVQWVVGRRPRDINCDAAVFTKTGTVTDASGGAFTVAILPADTQYLEGDYRHQAETTDGSGLKAIVTVGRFGVHSRIGA